MAGITTMTAGQSQKEVTFNEVTAALGKLQTITPGDSVTVDFSDGGRAYLLLDRATTTITLSGGYDGQTCLLILEQDGSGGRAVSFGSEVRYGADIPSFTPSSDPNKTDY